MVKNSVCCLVDDELIRILKSTDGMWEPGKEDDIPTPMAREVSLMFVSNQYTDDPKEYFERNAKNNFIKGNKFFLDKSNPEKALKYYDISIKYRPNEAAALLLRGLCGFEAGDKEGACSDWNRINAIGNANVDKYLENLCGLEGFEEMASILNE